MSGSIEGHGGARRAAARRAAGGDRRQGWRLAAALVLVAALVAAAHWPVLRAQALSFDDHEFITYNPLVTQPGWSSAARFFGEVLSPSTVKGYYLPLSMTSLMLDYAAGGRPDDLRVFHRTSLALHVLCTVVLALLLWRLFGAVAPAALAALLFGLHPLTVEPVAWVGERKTLLAALFAFAGLAAYVEHCRGRGRSWLPASVFLYLLALLSKPTVTMFPLLLLALDYWPLRRLSGRSVAEKWPFFLLSLLSGIITLISHERTAGFAATASASWLAWPLHAGYLLAFYLGKVLYPVDLTSVYTPPAPFSLANPAVLVPVLGVAALTAGLVLLVRRARAPLTGWLFFAIALAPTLGLVKYSWVVASDKYVYFPAAGLSMVLAWGLAAAWRAESAVAGPAARRALVTAIVLAVALAEAAGARAALRNWTTSLDLFRHMEALAPAAPAVHNELGVLLARRSREEEAARHLRRAVELAPEYGDAHYNLGVVLGSSGHLEEGIQHLRQAVELLPDDAHAAYNLGAALRLQGRLVEAEGELRRALRLQPDYAQAVDLLGSVLVMRGKLAEAVDQFRRAVSLAPQDAQVRFHLAMALTGLGGDPAEVAEHLREAIRLSPSWAEPYNSLAWMLATSPDPAMRDPAQALALAERAAQLSGRRDPKVLDTLAAAQAAGGDFASAVATARTALALAGESSAGRLAQEIRQRLRLFERGVAFVETEAQPAGPPS